MAIQVEEGRIADRKRDVEMALKLARDERAAAQTELSEARKKSAIMNAALALKETEITKREKTLEREKSDFEERMARVEKYETDLAKREIALRDGWKTLQATQKELHG